MAIVIALLSAYFAKSYRQVLIYSATAQVVWSLAMIPSFINTSKALQHSVQNEVLILGVFLGVIRICLLSSLFFLIKKKYVQFKDRRSRDKIDKEPQ
jgi:hypothetical protein